LKKIKKTKDLRPLIESIYKRFNKRSFVSPDPLQFLYKYKNKKDREIVALIASSLAYGNVKQIIKSVEKALGKMGKSPYAYVVKSSTKKIKKDFKDFKHRFTKGHEISNLLIAIKRILKTHGSLNRRFVGFYKKTHKTLVPASRDFCDYLRKTAGDICTLIPCPTKKSAFKRFNLFLRWMVRHDSVDLGDWKKLSPSKLIVPLDTHMHKIAKKLGLTSRKQADITTALEISENFKKISPDDPIKYDFSLTRFGIRDEMDIKDIK
jgi:uncharacterized protein (TIGR02757 family)